MKIDVDLDDLMDKGDLMDKKPGKTPELRNLLEVALEKTHEQQSRAEAIMRNRENKPYEPDDMSWHCKHGACQAIRAAMEASPQPRLTESEYFRRKQMLDEVITKFQMMRSDLNRDAEESLVMHDWLRDEIEGSDLTALIRKLFLYKPLAQDASGPHVAALVEVFKAEGRSVEDMEHLPLFSEAFLYELLGKEEARTLLSRARQVAKEAGIGLTDKAYP